MSTAIRNIFTGIDFRRQNLMSTDVRFCRLKSIPALWGLSSTTYTVSIRRWSNSGLILSQRRRRWANNKPPLFRRIVLHFQIRSREGYHSYLRSGLFPSSSIQLSATGRLRPVVWWSDLMGQGGLYQFEFNPRRADSAGITCKSLTISIRHLSPYNTEIFFV